MNHCAVLCLNDDDIYDNLATMMETLTVKAPLHGWTREGDKLTVQNKTQYHFVTINDARQSLAILPLTNFYVSDRVAFLTEEQRLLDLYGWLTERCISRGGKQPVRPQAAGH